MNLFDLLSKQKECCDIENEFVNIVEGCELKNVTVVGSSCCKSGYNLYEQLKEIIKESNVAVKLAYTDSIEYASEYGIISRPAIVIDDKVIACNNGIDEKELKELLVC
ncbi:MAG: thioredoxin family protein [Pseudobutyrivibrio sp.]|uniref:thioredoxin family protein n=1 Tax=Pseudobutyrivibrio sp. TaxID=2014367 RepID=UPI0025E3D8B0|nr:thioredoxin family protein [Pseudobutyrivibrio sp.]MBE5904818.1 thioredoxin family protein [Pseudobutyrivibrio sp.]